MHSRASASLFTGSTWHRAVAALAALALAWAGAAACAGGAGSAAPATDPGAGPATPPEELPVDPDHTVSYHRLRIEFLDQGDWATLSVADPSKVIKVREMSRAGTPRVLVVDRTQLALNTVLGSDLSVVADLALTPGAVTAPLRLSLTKGVAGTASIRVSMVVGDKVTLLREITRQATPLDFTVDLSALQGVAPVKAPMAPVEPMGLALYYPWYSLATWKSNPDLRDTPATPYASDDPVALARQIDEAQRAGINGFVVSWIGPGSSSDQNVKLLLAEAAKKGFRIGFFLETTGGKLADDPATATAWLSYIADEYTNAPGVLQVAGRPVVIPWVTSTIPAATWAKIRADVRARGKDVWLVQDCQDMDYLATFDGVFYSGSIAGLGEKVRYYSVLADSPAPKLWMPTAMPGYDERLLDDRVNPRYIDRAGGAHFRSELDHAFANAPQWVTIYTWNEWFEETYIEPSVAYGDQYLQIAGQYLKELEKLSSASPSRTAAAPAGAAPAPGRTRL